MLRKILAALVILTFVGCAPSYADAVTLNGPACQTVNKATKDVLADFRAGKTQFEVMTRINGRPTAYWNNSNAAKVYTQVIVIDLMKNIKKGFKDQEILKTVNQACMKDVTQAF